ASASATTWLLVRIVPSAVRMVPDPDAPPCGVRTSILTTLGSTFWATDSTEPAGAGSCDCDTGDVDTGLASAVAAESSCVASQRAAPPKPAPPPTTSDVASTAAARPARRRRGSGPGRDGCSG